MNYDGKPHGLIKKQTPQAPESVEIHVEQATQGL